MLLVAVGELVEFPVRALKVLGILAPGHRDQRDTGPGATRACHSLRVGGSVCPIHLSPDPAYCAPACRLRLNETECLRLPHARLTGSTPGALQLPGTGPPGWPGRRDLCGSADHVTTGNGSRDRDSGRDDHHHDHDSIRLTVTR
eukprot:1800464-Rhodomonas_salina.1